MVDQGKAIVRVLQGIWHWSELEGISPQNYPCALKDAHWLLTYLASRMGKGFSNCLYFPASWKKVLLEKTHGGAQAWACESWLWYSSSYAARLLSAWHTASSWCLVLCPQSPARLTRESPSSHIALRASAIPVWCLLYISQSCCFGPVPHSLDSISWRSKRGFFTHSHL